MFSTSGGKAMEKQIEATHEPVGIEISMKPILDIVEDIFRRASPTEPGTVQVKALPPIYAFSPIFMFWRD